MRRSESYPLPSRIVSVPKLQHAWKNCRDSRGAGGAPGIDNISPAKFRENLESNCKQIRGLVLSGKYQFARLKPHPIPKDNGKHRIICVPTVQDRLLQRLILKHLTYPKDLLGVLNGVSYGVTRGQEQGTHAAIDKAITLRNKHPWVLKTDISAFFDNIPRERLQKIVSNKLKRHSLVPLLKQVINCEVDERGRDTKEILKNNGIQQGKGLRQGMPLSPLLANLVLGNFDKKIAKHGIKMLRYMDDLVVLADSEEECLNAKGIIEKELDKIKLKIPELNAHQSKTEKVAPDKSVVFLGLEIYRQNNGNYAKKIPEEAIREAFAEVEKISSYKHCLNNKCNTLTSALSWLENIPGGYRASYKGATNLDTFYVNITAKIQEVKKKLLEDIFGTEAVAKLNNDKLRFLGFIFAQ